MALNRKSRKKTVYHLKKGAHNAAKNVVSAVSIFFIIALISGGFVFFQWKNFIVNRCLSDNDKLRIEILALNEKRSRLDIERNVLYKEIPEKAKSIYGMVSELDKTNNFAIDKNKFANYEKKDKQPTK